MASDGLGDDRTGLGLDIARAKRMYTLPPRENTAGDSGDLILNPATGQLEDKNGNPVAQVRSQGLKPGQFGGIDTGSGPTQFVNAGFDPYAYSRARMGGMGSDLIDYRNNTQIQPGFDPYSLQYGRAPLAGGASSIRGPYFDSGFSSAGGGGFVKGYNPNKFK